MVKVFISQPMKGRTKKEILEERADLFSRAKERYPDAVLIDSWFQDYKPSTGNVALKYLAKSLERLADADVAYFAKGCENARGCKIEHDAAVAYGLEIIYED